jgi:outer membrane autotransporter protein
VTTVFNGLATFTNAGLITMHNGVAGDLLRIGGSFIGTGGSIALDTALGGDNSPTDKVLIVGSASGTTHLLVYNAGGLGAQTVKGIDVVEISGGTTKTAFDLGMPVEAGAYAYALAEVTTSADRSDFLLQSTFSPTPTPTPTPTPPPTLLPNYRNEVPVYLAMPELANQLGFAMIDNYDARMGGGREDYVTAGADGRRQLRAPGAADP